MGLFTLFRIFAANENDGYNFLSKHQEIQESKTEKKNWYYYFWLQKILNTCELFFFFLSLKSCPFHIIYLCYFRDACNWTKEQSGFLWDICFPLSLPLAVLSIYKCLQSFQSSLLRPPFYYELFA